jgi:glutathione S-transferase
MTLTLYTNPQSRGRIARWMLEEVGEPYETRIVEFGPAMKGPEYRAINPMGKVPALVHDGKVVTENAAILSYLAEAFPGAGLMPEDRAGFWRWMYFGAGPLEYAQVNRSFGWDVTETRDRGRLGYGSYDDVIATLRAHLQVHDYLCDERFTVVDVFIGSQVGFGLRMGMIDPDPAFTAYWERLFARPAGARARDIDDRLVAERQAAHA